MKFRAPIETNYKIRKNQYRKTYTDVYQTNVSEIAYFFFTHTRHISYPLTICVHHCAATAHLVKSS